MHLIALDVIDLKSDEAVIDEDDGALLDLARKVVVIKRKAIGVTWDTRVGRYDDLIICFQNDIFMILKLTGANLGTLCVKHDSDRYAELLGDSADALDVFLMIRMGSMGEVEARDIHSPEDQLAQHFVVVCGRAHRTYDLSSLIHATPCCHCPVFLVFFLPGLLQNLCHILRYGTSAICAR